WSFVEKLVGQSEADIPDVRVPLDRGLAVTGTGAAGTRRLVGGFAVDKGDVDFELPALSPVVPCGQVEGEGVGVDLVDAEVAEEDGIQGQHAIADELLGIVGAVGAAGRDDESATAERAAGLLVEGFDAGGRFGLLPQDLPIACPAAAGCRSAGRSGTG